MGKIKTDQARKKKKMDKNFAKYIADNFFHVGEAIEVRGLKYVAVDLVHGSLQVVFECVGVVQHADTVGEPKGSA